MSIVRPIFNTVETAYEFLSSFLPEEPPGLTKIRKTKFDMTRTALRNTLNYILNELGQSALLLTIQRKKNPHSIKEEEKEEKELIVYRIKSIITPEYYRSALLEIYEEYISRFHIQHNQLFHSIKKKISNTNIRLMQGIIKPSGREGISETINDYELFLKNYSSSIPEGIYLLNMTDAIIMHAESVHPYTQIFGNRELQTPYPFLPIFGGSGHKDYLDIPIPNYDDIIFSLRPPIISPIYTTQWEDKLYNMAIFRGSPSGAGTDAETNPRIQIAKMSYELKKYNSNEPQWLDACLTSRGGFQTIKIDQCMYKGEKIKRIGFINVSPKWVGPRKSMEEQSQYKYIIHIDGNVGAFRLLESMTTGSLILRVESDYRQWSDAYLRAGEHYLPIRSDLSNLKEMVLYCQTHQDECKKIAEQGRLLAEQMRTEIGMANACIDAFTFWNKMDR